jgi:hypothetical protein
LAIVYQIVQAHQAQISVSSTLGKGSEFLLQFPRLAEGDHASNRHEAQTQPVVLARAGGARG